MARALFVKYTYNIFFNRPYRGCLTKPRITTNGAHDPNEKIPEPYRTIRIILHFLYESAIRGSSGQVIVLADWNPSRCSTLRKYSRIITYPCCIGQTLRINLPCLTYALTVFTYQPYTVARINYTILYGYTHSTIKVNVLSEHEPNISRIEIRSIRESITYHTNYITYPAVRYRPYKTYC